MLVFLHPRVSFRVSGFPVASPVLLSRRENKSGAIGLSIDIFISYHNRYFNIVIFNIRVSIRVRGLHLVSAFVVLCSCCGFYGVWLLWLLVSSPFGVVLVRWLLQFLGCCVCGINTFSTSVLTCPFPSSKSISGHYFQVQKTVFPIYF